MATGITKEDLLRAMRLIKKDCEHEVFFLKSPDMKKVEKLERHNSAKQLLVEKSLNLEGWPEQEPDLSPNEVEDAISLNYPPFLPFKMCLQEILVAKIGISCFCRLKIAKHKLA